MKIEITDSPSIEDEDFVKAEIHAHAENYMPKDVRNLCAFIRDDAGKIIAGLISKTYWSYLGVEFLWVDEAHRGNGHGASLLASAEMEAKNRGCKFSRLDTFSFQALEFYIKLGYKECGKLSGYTNNHERYYLNKALV